MSQPQAHETAQTHSTSEIYDRQIRLWGADAQSKISSARVLYIHVTGVSSEILKNLLLAGVSASIYDPRPYPTAIEDTPTCFFPQPYDDNATETISVGKAIEPYIMELNPLIKDSLEICDGTKSIEEELNEDYIKKFDIVIASQLSIQQCIRLSKLSSKYKNYFIVVDTFGYNGCGIIDLGYGGRTYKREMGKDKLSDDITIGDEDGKGYVSLEDVWSKNVKDALGRWDKAYPPKIWLEYRLILQYVHDKECYPTDDKINEFVQHCKNYLSKQNFDLKYLQEYYGPDEEDVNGGLSTLASLATAQVSPVCSILGGVVGNEVIKILSGKGEPANNLLLLDGMEGLCRQFFIQ